MQFNLLTLVTLFAAALAAPSQNGKQLAEAQKRDKDPSQIHNES